MNCLSRPKLCPSEPAGTRVENRCSRVALPIPIWSSATLPARLFEQSSSGVAIAKGLLPVSDSKHSLDAQIQCQSLHGRLLTTKDSSAVH